MIKNAVKLNFWKQNHYTSEEIHFWQDSALEGVIKSYSFSQDRETFSFKTGFHVSSLFFSEASIENTQVARNADVFKKFKIVSDFRSLLSIFKIMRLLLKWLKVEKQLLETN